MRSMLRCWTSLVILSLVSLAPLNPVCGQGSRADYQRADALRRQTRETVFRWRVEPHWLSEQNRFWYDGAVGPKQHRFVLVDADAGRRTYAFDHRRLAESLAAATSKAVNADRLPFRSIAFSPGGESIRFTAHGRSWECSLGDYELQRTEAESHSEKSTVTVLPFPRRSSRTGAESIVLFVNRTSAKVKLYWVVDVDNLMFYADVEPGKRHQQHTYGGHVWVAKDETRERLLGVFEATDFPAVAIIDGTWRPGRQQDETDGRRRGRGGPRPSRSPDEQWEAQIVSHNVVVRNEQTGEELELSTDGSADDPYLPRFFWSADSQRLVVIQERAGENRQVHFVESAPDDQVQPQLHTLTYVKPGDRIAHARPRLFDLSEQKQINVAEDLFPNPWRISDVRWSPDSDRFTFLYNQRGHQTLRVVAVDAETGAATPLIDEVSETFLCYSSKQFLHHLEETGEIIWMSERDGWNHIYLYDGDTGRLKNQITEGEWVVRGVERVDAEHRQIWFTAGGIRPEQDPYHVHYCRIDFDGSNLVVLTEGDGTHSIEYSPDGVTFIDTYSRVDLPSVTELRRTSDGSLLCELERGDWSALLETGWQPPERFVAKGRDGETDIYGVIFRPTTFDPEKQYPVIENIYAGPHSAHVPKRFASYHGSQSMAELGFLVVQIDGMGTSQRSKAFHDVCWQNLADSGFPDRVLWMQAAAETRPWMDLSRVGIYGGSAGGQSAMRALIDHSDFYDAAVADCGCHDNRMDKIWWNEQWMGWPLGPHYAQSSNVEQAHRLQGKLMLIVGELDRNVDPASTMQVVDALIQADKDFALLVIPGAGHGAGSGRYGTRRQRDFFVRHLLNVEPRWE